MVALNCMGIGSIHLGCCHIFITKGKNLLVSFISNLTSMYENSNTCIAQIFGNGVYMLNKENFKPNCHFQFSCFLANKMICMIGLNILSDQHINMTSNNLWVIVNFACIYTYLLCTKNISKLYDFCLKILHNHFPKKLVSTHLHALN